MAEWAERTEPDDVILARYRRWLLKVASEMIPHRPGEWQDLAQEGWIAMWRALRTHDATRGALPVWLTGAARLRMTDVARRSTWTGTPGVRGHHREEPARPVDPASPLVRDVACHSRAYDDVELAYHDGEILRALTELPPGARDALLRRCWGDEVVNSSYWRSHRERLAERLGHLRDVS